MKQDYFRTLEQLAFTARIKRISDNLLYSAKDLYRELGLDIDPNWHLVFLMLRQHKTLTMTQIADAFQISQTAVIKTINKMKSRGYLNSTPDRQDSRKQLLSLSSKALQELPRLQEVWEAGKSAIDEILAGHPDIFNTLSDLEAALAAMDYKQRSLKHLNR